MSIDLGDGYLSDVHTQSSHDGQNSDLSHDLVVSTSALERSFKDKYQFLRNAYEDRIRQLSAFIEDTCDNLFSDELISAMKADPTTATFVPGHALEIIDTHLKSEREQYIHTLLAKTTNLEMELARVNGLNAILNKNVLSLEKELIKKEKVDDELSSMQKKFNILQQDFKNSTAFLEKENSELKKRGAEAEAQSKAYLRELQHLNSQLADTKKENVYYKTLNDNKTHEISLLEQSFEQGARELAMVENIDKQDKQLHKELRDQLTSMSEKCTAFQTEAIESRSQLTILNHELNRLRVELSAKQHEEESNKERMVQLMRQVDSMLAQETQESNEAINVVHEKTKQFRQKMMQELQKEKRLSIALQEELSKLKSVREDSSSENKRLREEESVWREKLSREQQKYAELLLDLHTVKNDLTDHKIKLVEAESRAKQHTDKLQEFERLRKDEASMLAEKAKLQAEQQTLVEHNKLEQVVATQKLKYQNELSELQNKMRHSYTFGDNSLFYGSGVNKNTTTGPVLDVSLSADNITSFQQYNNNPNVQQHDHLQQKQQHLRDIQLIQSWAKEKSELTRQFTEAVDTLKGKLRESKLLCGERDSTIKIFKQRLNEAGENISTLKNMLQDSLKKCESQQKMIGKLQVLHNPYQSSMVATAAAAKTTTEQQQQQQQGAYTNPLTLAAVSHETASVQSRPLERSVNYPVTMGTGGDARGSFATIYHQNHYHEPPPPPPPLSQQQQQQQQQMIECAQFGRSAPPPPPPASTRRISTQYLTANVESSFSIPSAAVGNAVSIDAAADKSSSAPSAPSVQPSHYECDSRQLQQHIQMQELQKEYQQLQDRCLSLTAQQDEVKREAQQTLAALRSEMQSQIDSLRAENASAATRHRTQVMDLQSDIEGGRARIKQLLASESKVLQLETEVLTGRSKINELTAALAQTAEQSACQSVEHKHRVLALQSELDIAKQHFEQLSEKGARSSANIGNLSATVQATTNGSYRELTELKAEIDAARLRIHELENDNLTQERNYQTLDIKYKMKTQQLAENNEFLQQKLKTLSDSNAASIAEAVSTAVANFQAASLEEPTEVHFSARQVIPAAPAVKPHITPTAEGGNDSFMNSTIRSSVGMTPEKHTLDTTRQLEESLEHQHELNELNSKEINFERSRTLGCRKREIALYELCVQVEKEYKIQLNALRKDLIVIKGVVENMIPTIAMDARKTLSNLQLDFSKIFDRYKEKQDKELHSVRLLMNKGHSMELNALEAKYIKKISALNKTHSAELQKAHNEIVNKAEKLLGWTQPNSDFWQSALSPTNVYESTGSSWGDSVASTNTGISVAGMSSSGTTNEGKKKTAAFESVLKGLLDALTNNSIVDMPCSTQIAALALAHHEPSLAATVAAKSLLEGQLRSFIKKTAAESVSGFQDNNGGANSSALDIMLMESFMNSSLGAPGILSSPAASTSSSALAAAVLQTDMQVIPSEPTATSVSSSSSSSKL